MKNLIFFSALLVSFAVSVKAQPSPASTGLRVEVLVFSGRPNPVFTVTDPAQIGEILNLASSLPRSAVARRGAEAPALGYRGIVVTNLSAATASEIQNLQVHRGAVQVTRKLSGASANASPGTADSRDDKATTLETRLLAMALSQGAIDKGLLALINSK